MSADPEGLRQALRRMDGRSYGAYKSLPRRIDFGQFLLHIDHVQGDPFAAPTRLCVEVPWGQTGFRDGDEEGEARRRGLCDFVHRVLREALTTNSQRRGSGKSGLLEIVPLGQEVLERSAVVRTKSALEARVRAGLPARGRRILADEAVRLLCEDLPSAVEASLFRSALDDTALEAHLNSVEDSSALRDEVERQEWVAFVANGARLPRRSGVDDRPLDEGVVAFESPASLEACVVLPHAGEIRGMAIPEGITLLVGGGYHGKSTLLQALQRGVYDHIPGDGRERVVTRRSAVSIRAEDGRSVAGVDISLFISDLPQGRGTKSFTSADASGSTSQAAAIVEAMESGATVLLLDEDTSATNFMIRDDRMQALIHPDKEPITPFVHRVRWLFEERGVSTVLVMGGSGEPFDVADRVVGLEHYRVQDRTADAKAIAEQLPRGMAGEEGAPELSAAPLTPRIPSPRSLDPRRGRREVSIRARGRRELEFGTETVDLSAVQQLVEEAQVRALGEALLCCESEWLDGARSVADLLDAVERRLDQEGLDGLSDRRVGDLARFRRHELSAALSRIRSLAIRPKPVRSPTP